MEGDASQGTGGTGRQVKVNPKHIVFIETEQKPKTKVWEVCTKTFLDTIGEIRWYGPWRQYCFFPEDDCTFSGSCLKDIIDFMAAKMEAHKRVL